MAPRLRLCALLMLAGLAVPAPALASDGTVPRVLDLGVGVVALVLAALMLLDVLALRRVASGAAIAENVSHVMAAVICLATSVIVRWFVRFSPDDTVQSIASLGADLLLIAAMAFFALYFFLVRRAMVRFLRPMSAEEYIAATQPQSEARDDEPGGLPAEECNG